MFIFDSLAYSEYLTAGGVDQKEAKAHAFGIRDFVIKELATKDDILSLKTFVSQELHSNDQKMTIKMLTMFGCGSLSTVGLLFGLFKLFPSH